MKIKLFVLLLFASIFPLKVSCQITLSVDSLIVNDVLWLSRNDVWIEDFAYGPHLRFVCSITNNSDETIVVDLEKGVSFEFGSRKHYRKKIFVDYSSDDSTLAVPSGSRVQINGDIAAFFLDGKRIVGDNYQIVNFLPSITKTIKKSHVVIQVENHAPLKAALQNCFVGGNFLRIDTISEPILDIGVSY